MHLEVIKLREAGETEKDKYYMISLICGILKENTNELTDIENKLTVTKRERRRDRQIRTMGLTDIHLYTSNKQQRFAIKDRDCSQYLVIIYNGKESENVYMCN